MTRPPASPLRYDPAYDRPKDDEEETAAALTQTMLQIADTTFADCRHAMRSVHVKSHGLLKADLEVLPGLDPVLAQGLFATPRRYEAVMRFSAAPGDLLPDSVSTQRGLAIKVIGVTGERLEGTEEEATQDFVLANPRRFNAPGPKPFLAALKGLALTTDRMEGAKKAVSAVMRTVEKGLEAIGTESATARLVGGEPPRHVLGETYFSQLPLRYGYYMAKLQVVPVSPELTALTGEPVDLEADPDVLRQKVIEHFRKHGGVWELRVQLCTDLDAMPIVNPMKDWDEDKSPFVAVARLTAGPQTAWSEARSQAIDDGMAFSPWQGLQAHRPLGQLMRMRKMAYARSRRFRSERNQTPVSEPKSLEAIPD